RRGGCGGGGRRLPVGTATRQYELRDGLAQADGPPVRLPRARRTARLGQFSITPYSTGLTPRFLSRLRGGKASCAGCCVAGLSTGAAMSPGDSAAPAPERLLPPAALSSFAGAPPPVACGCFRAGELSGSCVPRRCR